MIGINFRGVNGQIAALVGRFRELPNHIARKHLQAAMKRAVKDGVPVLKRLTPKGKTRVVDGARVRGGALRRGVRTKSQFVPKKKVVYGVVGFQEGEQSLKARWTDGGTKRVPGKQFMKQFQASYGGPAAKTLARELKNALEKAANEIKGKRNPGGRRT